MSSQTSSTGETSLASKSTHNTEKPSSKGDEEMIGMRLAVSVGSPDAGAGGDNEMLDPAILAMTVEGRTTHRQYQYSREKLLSLRDVPLSRQRPDILDPAHNNAQGLWDPERWHHDWKRSETPNDGASREQMSDNHKRRCGDPRERIRKEQDGIVLSPQRRSFNSGCFVPVAQTTSRPNRPDSPLGSKDQHLGHREISQGMRRIGSGRIIARDVSWDYRPEKTDLDTSEYGFGRSGPPPSSTRDRKDTDREDRYERRPFGRDFERDREKDRHILRNGRYNDRRRISSDSKDEEPEWFSGGPTSQADTIELRGFEDVCESERAAASAPARKKQSPSQKKRKERAITKNNTSEQAANSSGTSASTNATNTSTKEESPKGPGARSTPTPQETTNNQYGTISQSPIKEEQIPAAGTSSETDEKLDPPVDANTTSAVDTNGPLPPSIDFNLEDFLKMDSIPDLLTNGGSGDFSSSAGSRFSRWFNKEASPVHREEESRRSSLQDEQLVNNIINGLGESDTYFAPISPAAATGSSGGNMGVPPPAAKPVTLLEILQRGKQSAPHVKQPNAADIPPSIKHMDVPGKVLSLEELEARMRHGSDRPHDIPPPQTNRNKPEEDMAAFKRLLAQVSGGQAIPANNGPLPMKTMQVKPPQPAPMSLLQMLNKSQQEDARAAQHHGLLGPPSPGAAAGPPPHVPNDLVLKLHQVQQHQQRQQQVEMFSKLMNNSTAGGHRQQFGMAQHPPDMGQAIGGPGRELLQRPEAVAILQGLKCGDITPQHLIQQLAANPAMQPRHRELLMTILKQNATVMASPRVLSPVPPPGAAAQHMLFQQQQQQQQMRLSPLPPAAYCVSPILATSPNTLTVHHPGMQQRIPSPRELQAHTQNIMQRALIKKKLEEQQENFRKKQEMQQRAQSPAVSATTSLAGSNTGSNVAVSGSGTTGTSPAKHLSSPTPLAFTPTSVLRKMTAEKECETPGSGTPKDLNKNTINEQQKQPQGRPVTGMRQPNVQPPQQPNIQQQSWNMQQQQQLKQPVGRPIVKGNNNYQFMQQDYQHLQMSQHARNLYQPQRGKINPPQNQQQFNLQNRVLQQQQQQQQQQSQLTRNMQNLQQMQRGHSWQHFINQNYENRGMPIAGRSLQVGRGSPGDGDLSPTSDQLARWFSPELLAQARAGKLPDMPTAGIAQNALSLEELERIQQSAAPVHN